MMMRASGGETTAAICGTCGVRPARCAICQRETEHDDHLLVVADGSRLGCSAHSSSLSGTFSVSCFSDWWVWCDAPSSTSTSCVRGEELTHEVQMNVTLLKKEIFRRFVDCFPSLLADPDGTFSTVPAEAPFPCPLSLPLLRLLRVLTGMVSVAVVHDPFSLAFFESVSNPVCDVEGCEVPIEGSLLLADSLVGGCDALVGPGCSMSGELTTL